MFMLLADLLFCIAIDLAFQKKSKNLLLSFLEALSGLEVEGVVERLRVEQQREAVRLPHLRSPLNRPVVLAEYLKFSK